MTTEWDYLTDLVVVGSGGGLTAPLLADAENYETLVLEKTPLVGGSTAMSGGVIWLPNNPLMQDDAVADSFEEGMAYFDAVVGDAGPASSLARRSTYINEGAATIRFLQSLGVEFVRCEGYSDYYAGVADTPAGKSRGRAIESVPFDARELGPWRKRLRAGTPKPRTVHTYEIAPMGLARRNPRAAALAARVATRTIVGRLKRQALLTSGAALIGQLLALLVARSVPVWTETSLEDLVVEDGRVVGVVVSKRGKQMRIGARAGVLLAAGGFARNDGMRREFGRQPSSTAWTSANPGDTGEVLRIAMKHGAATDLMDEAWWIPSSVLPDGSVATCNADRCRPGTMIVDTSARRYFNEAVPYMEAGQLMYEHERSVGGAIPSWLLLDARARERYPFAYHPPGVTPEEWLTSGYMKKADTLTELARMCAIDPIELTRTVERFNGFAATGADRDFGRGESAHERYQGDITHKPNPSLGAIDKPPYYAVALYPGDVGTSGGLLCDENSRVLNEYGEPMPGLYATGNCTASVMGRAYLGPGASIGASLFFAYVAATHALENAGEHSGATF